MDDRVGPAGAASEDDARQKADLSEVSIRTVVEDFYGRVRADPDLGPMFESRLGDRWAAHLERMCDFWTTVLLGTRCYRGTPMESHMRIPDLAPPHFTRWMRLFARTVRTHLTESAANDMIGRAERMRWALQRSACGTASDASTPLPLTTLAADA